MARREFLKMAFGMPLMAGLSSAAGGQTPQTKRPLNIMMKSAWGSDDPTKAAFPFLHGHALLSAGHNVQIFLLGEAVGLMRKSEAEAVVPVGWPPLINTLQALAQAHVPIYACGACSRARNVTEADLANWGAKFGSPPIFVSLVEWADRVITE
jgi:predicted peroxiredoxin